MLYGDEFDDNETGEELDHGQDIGYDPDWEPNENEDSWFDDGDDHEVEYEDFEEEPFESEER